MNKFTKILIPTLIVSSMSLTLTGCSNDPDQNRRLIGTTAGAVAGGFIGRSVGGNNALGAIIGGAVGAAVGGGVAEEYNKQEKKK